MDSNSVVVILARERFKRKSVATKSGLSKIFHSSFSLVLVDLFFSLSSYPDKARGTIYNSLFILRRSAEHSGKVLPSPLKCANVARYALPFMWWIQVEN